ncbi:hypothetical protein Ade02nite_37910 [Paractinoplanes deccanensis]|uniref:Acyltransferase 3 domain-containing protein n=1 Tax=Paractinoplanes deccanensis TaxID=113561 RepID=A0ABQ3Y5J8_9ACTN|nr:acyltransferase [Actinoplanes deccanensis]GID75150.1 hypothetical protein Ade02nite_37910 [Actinoplanes deccanensis]
MTATLAGRDTGSRQIAGATRLGWLDALRGYAALVVVLFHLSPQVLGAERHLAIMRHIDFGKYGVLLFFLVSGYVIPMSLERHGDLRRFWIGRLCRIYPAYLATVGLVAVLVTAGLMHWPASLRTETVTGVLAHLTMTPDLAGVRGVVRVLWTLSYEMAFYLIVAGLFAWRLHRLSAWWAAGLALAAALAGPQLPDDLLGATFHDRRLTAAAVLLLTVLSVVAYVRRRLVRAAGAAGLAVVLLPALNGHPAPGSTVIASWQGLALLAVMFAGTVVYRCENGHLRHRTAAAALAVVLLAVTGAHWAHLGTRVWLLTGAAVAVTFAAAYALRHRAFPEVLTGLGRISYSLYLLHVVVLFQLPRLIPGLASQPLTLRLATGAGYLTAALVLAWISYRLVELPGQALGRRLTKGGSPAAERAVANSS